MAGLQEAGELAPGALLLAGAGRQGLYLGYMEGAMMAVRIGWLAQEAWCGLDIFGE